MTRTISWGAILKPGTNLSFCTYSGLNNEEACLIFDRMNHLKMDKKSLNISNGNDLLLSVKKVEMIIKERDLEYNLEFCDIVVSGVIL